MKMKTLFASLAMLLSSSYTALGQVSAYTFSQTLSTYTPLTGTPSVAFAAGWDDNVQANFILPVPFTFTFDGTPYTYLRISPNGYITFGATFSPPTNYTPLSAATAYNGAISAFGTNLVSNGTDNVVYGTEGTSPNQVFVIQWNNAVRSGLPGTYNFQIRLYETTNVIECSYGSCSTASTVLKAVQVGLRGQDNNFAQGHINNRSLTAAPINTPWLNNTTAGTNNFATVLTSNLAYPDLGLLYKWTPAPLCITPSAQPTALVLGSTSITNTTIVGNSFTAASPAPANYLVLRSTVNTPPTAVQVPNGTYGVVGNPMGAAYTVMSISNATTFTNPAALTPDTTYYYWVISYNNNCTGAPVYNLTNILTGSATTCSAPTVATAATSVAGNSFTANWGAVAGATNYRIDVATDSGFTSILPAYNNLSVGNVTTFPVTGLSSVTTYYYRIRAIGSNCAVNSNTITVATGCGSYPIPYAQNFDATAIGVVPTCYTQVNTNADASVWAVQAVTYASATHSLYIPKNTTLAMDDWFFLPGLNLTGGVSYRLFFRYNTGNPGATTENLKVQLGSSATVVGMTQTLMDLSNINNNIFKPAYVDFTPVLSGVYFIGFDGYSAANQSYIAIDDISVTLSPTCFEPTDITASAIAITTATISWTPPVPDPASGYQYYLSTSATPPVAATVPTGSVGFGINTVNLVGLTPSTSYYIWVRGKCSATDTSVWSLEETFSTECNTPIVASTTPASRCGFGQVTLAATPNAGSTINWYAAATGGSSIATGNSYLTPNLSTTTIYYAEARAGGAVAKVGPSSPITHGGTVGIQNFQSSINFTVTDGTTLQSIDIYPIASGQAGQLVIRNGANITQTTIPFVTSVSGGTTLQTIPINWVLAPGNYNLYLGTLPASGLSMNTGGTFYPYTSTVANITGNPIDNTQYLGFYNWKFLTQCLSGRIAVAANVASPPVLTISATDSIICEGTSTAPVTIGGAASYNNFTWFPNTNISGDITTGFIFNPTTTTTYTLTASQTSGSFCSTVLTHIVTVNPIPSPVAIIPASTVTICQNTIQPLNGSVGSASAVPILSQDFNGVSNDWVVANTSVDGDTNASQWTLRQSTYVYSSSNWNVSVKSNDNSKFYFSNADSQGSSVQNTLTRTTLQSPTFSLAGYTSATLNFWQYLRFVGDAQFLVQVSTNGGASWNTIKQYTATQGTALNFSNASIDLAAYLASSSVMVRFNYETDWNDGYGWAIDNVTISGTIATALSWSPATGLYTDSAATIPYILGNALAIVYAKPLITTTYTATATGSNSCTSSGQIIITVDPLPIGGTLGGNQTVCGGTLPSNITLTGSSGNVIRWEYADDAAFTINVTPITNTTTTLLPAQMGVFSTIRYFRAVVKSGVCVQVYSTVVSVSFPTTTWNGTTWSSGLPGSGTKAIFAGNFTSSANLSACSVQVTSGIVTIASGHSLLVDNEVTVTGGSLIFENDASLVQYSATAVNIGNIVYKRNTTPMVKYDYTYWSSPVASQTLGAFSPNSNPTTFYEWNTSIDNWSFVPGSTAMQKAKGYIVRAPDIAPFNTVTANIFYGSFAGVPNNGTITIPLALNGTGSLNLIGNPYPSAISADLFLSDPSNINIMNGTIYLWTHNTPITANVYTSNDYAVYNYMGGVGTSAAINNGVNLSIPTGNIAAGVSFFVEGLLANNATFRNTMRLVGVNNQFFRQNNELSTPLSTASTKHRLWLDITNSQGAFKQALVGYAADATAGYDRNYDGAFFDGGNVVGLYSINMDNKFTIQGLPLPFSTDDRVPLGFMTTVAGTFNITLSQFDGLFESQDVFLEDQYLHVFHNLKSGSYAFTTDIGTFDDRFVLRYSSEALSTPQFTVSSLVIYKPDSKWIVNSGNTTMKSIRVFDVRGSLLFENKAINASETSFYAGATNQVLLVQITSTDGAVVTKKVVN